MGTRLLLLPMRPPPRLGVWVAAASIAAGTPVVDPLAGDEHRAARP
jgi:hypothetical protein